VPAPVPAPAPAAVPLAEAVDGAAAPVAAGTDVPDPVGPPPGRVGWWDRYNPKDLLRALFALGAVIVVLWGAAPMAVAATNPHADTLLIEAANGIPAVVDAPSAPFTLTDQSGRSVSLASLQGKTVALTFLDPVCTTDCPLIAQDLRLADEQLGTQRRQVELVAVVNNPLYNSPAYTAAFDRQEGLDHVANWLYLTGSLDQLHQVWNDYGDQTELSPAGGMVAHNDIVYLIDRHGRTRVILNADPGDGSAEGSSFVSQLTSQISSVIHS
jgi:cytochrome oxidase Cu insertion factor (SCO1/SenC/PrrC family)